MTLKDDIFALIEARDWVSFAELSKLPGFNDPGGNKLGLTHSKHPSLLIWANMSEEAVAAMQELREEGSIIYEHGSVISYMVDGAMMKLPIARRIRDYKKPHWLPTFCRPCVTLTILDGEALEEEVKITLNRK